MNSLAPLSTELKQTVSSTIAWKYRVVPFKEGDGFLALWSDDSPDVKKRKRELEILLNRQVKFETLTKPEIDKLLSKHYIKASQQIEGKELNVNSEDFIDELIKEARKLGCSDIHIEAYQENGRIRMRLDGKLIERYTLNKQRYNEYVNKVKILSNLDIAEKRLPQDGRILVKNKDYKFDIRVSVLPTLHGEKMVLRLLSSDVNKLDIKDLGFTTEQYQDFHQAISKPQGLVLISGPTGSGKTTTLYSALKTLNKTTSNILTIEDPIEYTLKGVNQTQLNEKVGLDFAKTLRTFLRQDPDIIMVGEIRDVDTAQMAIRAAMTGHLVMSTLHTNSAFGIISRLIEMGISDYLIADTLNIAIAQRLIRLLCPHCKEEAHDVDNLPEPLRKLNLNSYLKACGCSACHGTGYMGRKAIYETIPISDDLRQHVINGTSGQPEMITLSDNAIALFKEGQTSLEEVYPYLI